MVQSPELKEKCAPWPVWKAVSLYYSIACLSAWLLWLPIVLGPDGLKVLHRPLSIPVFISLGTVGPCAAAFITFRAETGSWRAVRLLPRGWGWGCLLLGPLAVLFCYFLLFPAFLSNGTPGAWRWNPSAIVGIWVPMLNWNLFGGPLFEEFGWRGYLQPRLQQALPPWIAAVLVGILWGFWHLPLFIAGWMSEPLPVFVFILTGLAVVMAALFNASARALPVAILMHSAFNASSRYVPAYMGSTPIRNHPSIGILLGDSFLLAAVILVLATRGRLFRQPSDGRPAGIVPLPQGPQPVDSLTHG